MVRYVTDTNNVSMSFSSLINTLLKLMCTNKKFPKIIFSKIHTLEETFSNVKVKVEKFLASIVNLLNTDRLYIML